MWKLENKKEHHLLNQQCCSAHFHQNTFIWAEHPPPKQKHMLRYTLSISIRHKHQTTLPTSILWEIKQHRNWTKFLLTDLIVTQTCCSILSPWAYFDLIWGVNIPTGNSNLSFMMLKFPLKQLQNSFISENILWVTLTHFMVPDYTNGQHRTRLIPVTEHQVKKRNKIHHNVGLL